MHTVQIGDPMYSSDGIFRLHSDLQLEFIRLYFEYILAASIQNITLHGPGAWRPCDSTFKDMVFCKYYISACTVFPRIIAAPRLVATLE